MNKKLTFSQRIGETKVKSELQIDSMDIELKNSLWNVYHETYHGKDDALLVKDLPNREFYRRLWRDYLKIPLDLMPEHTNVFHNEIRDVFFKCNWFEVYDFIEIVSQLCDSRKRDQFRKGFNIVLERELSGFRFVGELITQIIDETEINEIERTIEMAGRTKLTGVREHLKTALSMLSDRKNPDYRNSVKESISAVESIAKIISCKSKATLGDALKIIEEKIELHGSLKKGFMALYGYTSDEDGIRHAMLNEPNVNFEDAKYMLVSCSAFINYLIMKANNAGIKI